MDLHEFTRMFAEGRPQYQRFAEGILHDHSAADDCVQQTWICVSRHCDKLEAAGIDPYILTALRNRCLDMIRRRGREKPLSQRIEPVAPPDDTPEDASARLAPARGALADIWKRLTLGGRDAIAAAWLEQDRTKAAASLGKDPGAFDTAKSRAISDFKELLASQRELFEDISRYERLQLMDQLIRGHYDRKAG
jgi:DNA-directed RNA polymerase specialized sigma24 family protein